MLLYVKVVYEQVILETLFNSGFFLLNQLISGIFEKNHTFQLCPQSHEYRRVENSCRSASHSD